MLSVEGPAFEGIDIRSFQVSREKAFLISCFVIAFLLRFLLIPDNSVINGDGAYYTMLGERFVSGDLANGISAYWSPLYSVLTGISSLLFSDREFAGRFVSLVAGTFLIVPGFALIDTFFGRPAAYIGTVLIVFHPFLVQSSSWVMTESLYTLVFTTLVLTFWKALASDRSTKFLLTGVLLGSAFLIKPEAVAFVILIWIFTLVLGIWKRKAGLYQALINCLVFLSGFLLLFAPYFVFLHYKTGGWTLSQKIAVNLPAADYDGDFLGLTRDGRKTMKDRVWGDDYENEPPAETVRAPEQRRYSIGQLSSDVVILGSKAVTLVRKQLRDYFPALIPYPFMVLAIIGLFFRPWTKIRAGKELYLFSIVLATLIGYGASAVEQRYLFPIIPILMGWAAHGTVEFSEWLVRTTGNLIGRTVPRHSASFAILIMLLFSFSPLYAAVFRKQTVNDIPFEERNAGLWIRDHAGGSMPLVMSSNITPAFYAHARHAYVPDGDLRTIVDYAKLRGADYLVFSERRMKDIPLFKKDENDALELLQVLYRDSAHPGHRIVVYQVLP